jgi:hypothetical protein
VLNHEDSVVAVCKLCTINTYSGKRNQDFEGDSDLEEGDQGSEEDADNVDKKIHKFESLLSRLQGVVTQMETAEKEVRPGVPALNCTNQ